MRNTPPELPIQERSDQELLECLCLELRNVGVGGYELPNGMRVNQNIRDVCAIHAELTKRNVEIAPSITLLSEQTSWMMDDLLADCLAYPERRPYARGLDGICDKLRCRLCGKAERPPDAKIFWYCDSCMQRIASAIQKRVPCEGMVIFRSYTPGSRCNHADSDTVLAGEEYEDGKVFGVCEKCIVDELARRRALPSL
jgi:hypothetical protein